MHIAQGLQACGSADYLAYPSCLQFVAGVTLRVVQVPVTDHTILESGLHARQKDALCFSRRTLKICFSIDMDSVATLDGLRWEAIIITPSDRALENNQSRKGEDQCLASVIE
ncbi:hypothetical protein T310_1867 [Rasamsonia emersonii CBS 393.64]|uniref:Uncharacterized protein n=1 Tax=Rasamsonia emersonii (strain ATCC 16479 / CBS 393.64 / IMI 116815) TaxID=1408163 RepID=A0A0F4Z244_RASE3|nr:hypothetical protein T310_1867 [Rasamsonia emersonii CBS 393.64]KKA24136.1 hypothetical protein T310_1867 [Rasamsonia emersonii CBS 393.64]